MPAPTRICMKTTNCILRYDPDPLWHEYAHATKLDIFLCTGLQSHSFHSKGGRITSLGFHFPFSSSIEMGATLVPQGCPSRPGARSVVLKSGMGWHLQCGTCWMLPAVVALHFLKAAKPSEAWPSQHVENCTGWAGQCVLPHCHRGHHLCSWAPTCSTEVLLELSELHQWERKGDVRYWNPAPVWGPRPGRGAMLMGNMQRPGATPDTSQGMHHIGAGWCCGRKEEDKTCATCCLALCGFLTSFAICLPLDNSPSCLPSLSQIFNSLMQLTCWSPFHRLQMHLSLRVVTLISVKTFQKVRTLKWRRVYL